jgi:hypothetical protein
MSLCECRYAPSLHPRLVPPQPRKCTKSVCLRTVVCASCERGVLMHGVRMWRVPRVWGCGSVFFRSVQRTAFCAACLLSPARRSLGVVNDGCACLPCTQEALIRS